MLNKEADRSLSPEETQQVQRLLSQYHQIAELLHTSLDQEQAQAALTVVDNLSKAAQIAFVKSLARENETDAADILASINATSQVKEVRKEARRGLLRLESSKILPQWKPPARETPAGQVPISKPPRFWKGFVSQTREEGEMQLLLCWEQGFEYSDVLLCAFVLNYWSDGVQDFFTEISSRRTINGRINELRANLSQSTLLDCTLAEGKRLIEEALSINEWRKTEPHKDYRDHLPTLNALIFQATDLGTDSGDSFITPDLETQEVLANFLGAWTFGDLGLAYDLLTEDSEIRDHLPRDEWIQQHRQWHQEAEPARLELSFVHDLPVRQSTLWLPPSVSRSIAPQKKEIEVGWSVELTSTPLSGTLKEMPFATAINKETGRSWFWTSYSLVRVHNVWRMQKGTDEGLALQGATSTDLQKRIKEYKEALERLIQQQQQDPNMETFLEEASWRLSQLLHFYDALIIQFPLDYQICLQAYESALLTGKPERVVVYLERMTQRFSEDRGNNLRRLGSTLTELATQDAERGMDVRSNQLLKRAEEALREALSTDEEALSRTLLAELFISQDQLAEAEAELLAAKVLPHADPVEVAIEAALGHITIVSERMAEAIIHYQRVCELDPYHPDAWLSLGFAHRQLGHMDEAEQNYLRAIEINPNDYRPYSELTILYAGREELDKAVDLLNRGLQSMPDSAILHALIASALHEQGHQSEAQRHLTMAESIDPELKVVQLVKEEMHGSRQQ